MALTRCPGAYTNAATFRRAAGARLLAAQQRCRAVPRTGAVSSGQVTGVAGLRVCRTFVRERIGRGALPATCRTGVCRAADAAPGRTCSGRPARAEEGPEVTVGRHQHVLFAAVHEVRVDGAADQRKQALAFGAVGRIGTAVAA